MHENLIRAAAVDPHGAAVQLQESPYLDEWLTVTQLDDIRHSAAHVRLRIQEIIDRGVATAEFNECDSEMVALGYLGTVLGSQRWLGPHTTADAGSIASEIRRVVLRSLVRGTSEAGGALPVRLPR